ncbi:hypothetical protein PL246_09465 [Salmonella enterica]|uniref:hypothetical protein n=1 Tax=Salmonella enterica TaxID=28901 RepID=UPI0018CFEF7E|nr:hypothetical protein [Salmonella enterica]MBH0365704.1 hypothetical protein [Salmonella enterica]MBH5273467.1 hypothetical protein [Salmonella enterica]MDO3888131.1 hypothetical protein [Salmonella enterica]MDO3938161.1 hypothetical protein [Salmonella enterica]MDO3954608.1 hypothetical protein [Salmonella enterica]
MTHILSPFALSGDKEQIPTATQETGEISFNEGYGPDYEKDLDNDTGAKTIERAKLNWLLYLITSEIKRYQEQGIPDYISKADNNNIDFAYPTAALVRYNGKVYFSLKDENTDKPDSESWSLFDPSTYLGKQGGTITGDLTITGSLDINGEKPYTPSNPQPSTAAGLKIGTVDTLSAGAAATAAVSGEPPNQILSLGIPQGQAGDPGPANTLTVGTVTTLEAGASATAEITGDAPEQVLNLGIPQGKDGGSEITISSDGETYSPDDNGVIKLGSAAGQAITHDKDTLILTARKIPDWVPSGAYKGLERTSSSADVIDWSTFAFTAGCSYSISKDSTNDPLSGRGVRSNASWSVTCLSNSFESGLAQGAFLIVRESWATKNNVYVLYRYLDTGISTSAQWMLGEIPMTTVF